MKMFNIKVNELTPKKDLILLVNKMSLDLNYIYQKNAELNDQIHKLEDKLKDLGKNYNGLNKKHQKLLKEYQKLTQIEIWRMHNGII